jgi:hypothetical protein
MIEAQAKLGLFISTSPGLEDVFFAPWKLCPVEKRFDPSMCASRPFRLWDGLETSILFDPLQSVWAAAAAGVRASGSDDYSRCERWRWLELNDKGARLDLDDSDGTSGHDARRSRLSTTWGGEGLVVISTSGAILFGNVASSFPSYHSHLAFLFLQCIVDLCSCLSARSS